MMKRYMRRGADAAALTAVWAGPWAGAVAGAAGEGTGNVNAAARGRGVSPHAQTAAHTTCPHVLQRSHLSNPAKMKVRLTKSGIEIKEKKEGHKESDNPGKSPAILFAQLLPDSQTLRRE